jgi:hypothetical protein
MPVSLRSVRLRMPLDPNPPPREGRAFWGLGTLLIGACISEAQTLGDGDTSAVTSGFLRLHFPKPQSSVVTSRNQGAPIGEIHK